MQEYANFSALISDGKVFMRKNPTSLMHLKILLHGGDEKWDDSTN